MESSAPYAISATDRSGLIVIVETLFMSWMIIVCLIRLYMRLAINGPVQLDDLVVFTASVMAVAHVGTVMDAVSHGLGQSQEESSPTNLKRAGESVYAANLLFLAGHGGAKISICYLLKRLGGEKNYLLCSKILTGMVMAWTIASILTIALSCFPQYQWTMGQHCSNINIAWKAITAFDIFTDILAFGLSVFLVGGLQMRWKEKSAVIFAFGTRIPMIILIILRQTYLDRSLFHPDPPLHLSDSIIATAVLLHCSIMVTTVPCLKPFIVAFNTGWGQGVINSSSEHPYFTPTGKGASVTRSRAYTTNQGEEEVDSTVARLSQDSQHSQCLIIHQTREWTVEEGEEYEMHSIQDSI